MRAFTEVRTLGLACVGSGAVSLVTAAAPFSGEAPRGLAALMGVVGLALGGGLIRAGEGVPRWVLHVVLVSVTALMALLVIASATHTGRVVTSYGFVWLAMYTAWFHPRPVAFVHLGIIATSLAVGLGVAAAPSPVQTWAFVMAAVGGVAVVLNHLATSLRDLADRDQLTGLLNRSAFVVAAERYMSLGERSGRPLTLALIDLDDFKRVNDEHGHAAGDELLVRLAGTWRGALRRSDVLARHGGDEFVVLMPDTAADDARRVLDELREVSGTRWSAGLADWHGDDLDTWLRRADEALYADKQARRGHRPPTPEPP